MKLSHILMQQKYEIEDILRLLKEGKSFEDLAKKYSQCPSAKQGGELGEINIKRLDPDFLEAAETLNVGEISGPVRTRFGYHLIKRIS